MANTRPQITGRPRNLQRRISGFSLAEMTVVVAVLMILAAISAPALLNSINNINIRSASVNLGGILQVARIEAVRKNSFYGPDQTTLTGGESEYFVDMSPPSARTGTYASGDPVVVLGSQITGHAGSGSGAPGESTFLSGLNFTVSTSSILPYFNARGLPCVQSGQVCPETAGTGFVYFLSQTGFFGYTSWSCIVVTPSGRVQQWGYAGNNNWIQM